MADDADTHEKDVEELDERMQPAGGKIILVNFMRVRPRPLINMEFTGPAQVPQDYGRRHGGVPGRAVRGRGVSVPSPPPRAVPNRPQLDAHSSRGG